MDLILLDHGYSKPWSAHPDASNARPLRMLFTPKQPRPSATSLEQPQTQSVDEPIDVVETSPAPCMPFDASKARTLMTECERHASFARPEDQLEDWEEKISKIGWTVQQNRVFTKVIKSLQSDRLARLAMEGVPNEPIARRQLVDKTAKRLRQALASVGWDLKVVQWLHHLLLDCVSVHLLASYLDALQTLKAKVPAMVDKMVSGTPPRHPSLSSESLGLLLKRPWDPVGTALSQQKPKKLPGNPLLLIAPSGPTQGGASHTKRLKFWQGQLSGLGKVVPVTMHTVNGGSGVNVALCLEHMIGAVRTKVLELKSHFPGRPIVLFGWNIGALVACHVSLVESVSGVVCLGFPFTGIHGPRGDIEDPLLDSRTPTLFLVGHNSSDCTVDQLQDLREHMRAETGLVVVGGADEQLRLSHRQKREEGLTQAMADRCIIDEVCQFLGSVLSLNLSLPDPGPDAPPVDQRKKRKRKTVQDVVGAAAFGLATISGQEAAVNPGTGRVSKRGGKVGRQASAAGGAPVLSQERTRGSPRKRQGRGGLAGVPRKRLALSVSQLSVSAASSAAALQSVAASSLPANLTTVSSAPELSGLLQGIRVGRPGSDIESALIGGRSLMSTSIPLSKLLTLGRLTDVTEGGVGSLSPAPTTAALLASAVKAGDSSDKDSAAGKLSQSQHILVRTGGTPGTPLTIPISMAHRLVGLGSGASPLVHITGTSTPSQIHQLLTSITRAAATGSTSSTPQTVLLTTSTASSVFSTAVPLGAAGEKTLAAVQRSRLSSIDTTGQLSQEKEEGMKGEGAHVKGEGQGASRGHGQSEGEKFQTIRLSQFHDFPLTTASLTTTTTLASTSQSRLTDKAGVTDSSADAQQPGSSVTVTRSLINTASMSGSVASILGKVAGGGASQSARAGSPMAASSVLGGRSAVLITSLRSVAQDTEGTVLKTVPSVSCATLLSRLEKVEGGTPLVAGTTSGVTPGTYMMSGETLGKVSSLLESSSMIRMSGQPTIIGSSLAKSLVGAPMHVAAAAPTSLTAGLRSVQHLAPAAPSSSVSAASTTTTPTSSGGGGGGRGRRDSASSSYAASAKPILPTVASTRTRRIRTPKQYDL